MTRETWKSNNLCVEAQIKRSTSDGDLAEPCEEGRNGRTRVWSEKRAILSGISKGSCVLDDITIPRRYRLIYRGIFRKLIVIE